MWWYRPTTVTRPPNVHQVHRFDAYRRRKAGRSSRPTLQSRNEVMQHPLGPRFRQTWSVFTRHSRLEGCFGRMNGRPQWADVRILGRLPVWTLSLVPAQGPFRRELVFCWLRSDSSSSGQNIFGTKCFKKILNPVQILQKKKRKCKKGWKNDEGNSTEDKKRDVSYKPQNVKSFSWHSFLFYIQRQEFLVLVLCWVHEVFFSFSLQ